MIDVSTLSVLQGLLVTLIERRGNAGRRVKELYAEVSVTNRAVEVNLKMLVDKGLVLKINGDVPRYYEPNVDSHPHPLTLTS